jgi:hypothetical protein
MFDIGNSMPSRTPSLKGATRFEVMTGDAGVFSLSPFATIILLNYNHHST